MLTNTGLITHYPTEELFCAYLIYLVVWQNLLKFAS